MSNHLCSYCHQDLDTMTVHEHVKSCQTDREKLIKEVAKIYE